MAGRAASEAAIGRHVLHPALLVLSRPAAGREVAARRAAADSVANWAQESKEEATVSGMTEHKGGQEGRGTEDSREDGLAPRTHLLWQRACDSDSRQPQVQSLETNIAEEDGAVAVVGRQGTADDRENQFSVRGHRGRNIARGS